MKNPGLDSHPRVTWSALFLALLVMVAAPLTTANPEKPRPAPLPQPTEAQLGAPVYPGATYQAEISGGMSQGDSYYWVFVTADPASKVAAFYLEPADEEFARGASVARARRIADEITALETFLQAVDLRCGAAAACQDDDGSQNSLRRTLASHPSPVYSRRSIGPCAARRPRG